MSSPIANSGPNRASSRRGRSLAPAKILEATQALLLEQGTHGLSIRKLSERCGYSAPTIYHHFGDKQGLIDALLEEHFRVLLERMLAIPAPGDPAQHLRLMAEAFVSFAIENPAHYQLLVAPREGDPVPSATAARALVREDLAELQRRGWLATDDLDVAFDVLWAMLFGLITLHLEERSAAAAGALNELAFDVVDAGLLMKGASAR